MKRQPRTGPKRAVDHERAQRHPDDARQRGAIVLKPGMNLATTSERGPCLEKMSGFA